MSQPTTTKSNEDLIELVKGIIEQFKALSTPPSKEGDNPLTVDEETTKQMVKHCETIIKHLQNPSVPNTLVDAPVKEEPHHYYCQCDQCRSLTGCDR